MKLEDHTDDSDDFLGKLYFKVLAKLVFLKDIYVLKYAKYIINSYFTWINWVAFKNISPLI